MSMLRVFHQVDLRQVEQVCRVQQSRAIRGVHRGADCFTIRGGRIQQHDTRRTQRARRPRADSR
eukprot:8578019-Pyramimonas_sp.AAC.1